MVLNVNGQFYRDISNYTNRKLLAEINKAITTVKNAQNISQVQHLIKLRKYKIHYRIRVGKDYRIGVIIKKDTVYFLRFGHRNIFYKKLFP
jgi:mRNA-degrading endonuclease RelE of RelBE toxin-antitoxin system